MRESAVRALTAALTVAFVAMGVGPAAAAAAQHSPTVAWAHSLGIQSSLRPAATSTSINWAGYDIKHSGVTDVKASWNVPQIAKACPSSLATYSSFWVGIDGDGSSTVEQIGTDTDCSGGSPVYYAWYEFYPASSHTLSMAISPADHMHGEVKYSTTTGKFTLTLKDLTTAKSFSISKAVTAKRVSAEWIAEAPSSGSSVLPLTNFGWVSFSNATATIGGVTHGVGGFSWIAITMWNIAGTAVKAVPSAISGGHAFKVTWKSRGP